MYKNVEEVQDCSTRLGEGFPGDLITLRAMVTELKLQNIVVIVDNSEERFLVGITVDADGQNRMWLRAKRTPDITSFQPLMLQGTLSETDVMQVVEVDREHVEHTSPPFEVLSTLSSNWASMKDADGNILRKTLENIERFV